MDFELKRKENGQLGLFTTGLVQKWTNIADLTQGVLTADRTKTSIQIDENTHCEHPWAVYINHSFSPNCYVVGTEIYTVQLLQAGEELLFDYTSNEDDIISPFIDDKTGQWVGSLWDD